MSRALPSIALSWCLLLCAGTVPAAAGAAPPAGANPTTQDADAPSHRTGDAWLDRQLADIDRYAARYPDAFAAELERYAGVPRAYVLGLLAQPGWAGGDAWFACFLARATEATCRSVIRARALAGADAGWEEVADGFGARPGSEAYATVRLALADSYARWARPLRPDAALKRALREREKAEGAPAAR